MVIASVEPPLLDNLTLSEYDVYIVLGIRPKSDFFLLGVGSSAGNGTLCFSQGKRSCADI